MTTYIIRHTATGCTVSPWDNATPSDRKRHRLEDDGFTINARDETTLRRTLNHYFKDTP